MLHKFVSMLKTRWFIALACIVLGAFMVLGIRFVTYKPGSVHYHANFALYINGQHQLFKGAAYYEETETCAVEGAMTPAGRAHMHDGVNNVVHVEDHAVTWGQFFANLGWYMGPNFIQSPDGTMYAENGQNKLHILLNGQDYTDLGGVTNTVIKDQDKLLVSFGNEGNTILTRQYQIIPSTARQYDTSKDTGSCGSHGASSMHDRFTHLT